MGYTDDKFYNPGQRTSSFKQVHELQPGDNVALHYGEPCGKVVGKYTGNENTVVILEVQNSTPVRFTAGG